MATKQFQNAKLNVTHLDLKDDTSRSVLQSGENISHSLGKIARWYKDIIWTDSKATTEAFGIVKLSDDYKSESTETVPTSKTLNDVVKLIKQTGGWNTTYDFNSNIEGDENLQNGQFKVTEHDLEGDIDHYVSIKGLGSAAFTNKSDYATADHTHNYAGSDSVGGAATSANKLNTDAGSDVNPIYFSNGIPVACTYSLNKTVPSNALFTDAKVTQTATTTDADYEILFSSTADNTTRTEGARKNSNLTFNPSTGVLTTTKFVGELSGNATTATTANKLSNTTAIGSSIKPVYFSADGIPVAIDHSIETSVPSNAVFTDTTYIVSSGDNNGQIKVTPSEGDPYNVSVKGLGSAAYTDSDDYAMADHTHKYAGSSSVGGVANSAAKLSDIPTAGIGSETKPVFFSGTTGRPIACTYSLNATVPANAIFTDEKVKQSPVTTDGSFEVLFAGSTGNTEKTEGIGKTTTLTFNPSTGALSATSFSGNGSGLTSLNASNISSGTLAVDRLPGSAVTVGTYGPAAGGTLSHSGTFDVPDFTVDTKGRITGAHTRTFTLPAQYTHPTHTSKASGLYKITIDSLGHVSGTAAVTKSDIPALDYVSSTTTRNPNVVLAGPASGTAVAAPTFRALVVADLPASGATAGSYGPSANATPGYGATFNVPYITVDAKGRVTAISTKTVKIPASDNTNTTYTFATGDNNGTFKVIPSGGTATNIAIKGLGSAAYTASSAYAAASHTHNYAGSSTAGGVANSAAKLSTARTINGVKFDGTANIIVPRSIKHIHYANGTNGTSGYVKICTVGTNAAYGDQPIRITIGQRRISVYDIFIVFENSASAKATIRDAYFRSNRLAKQSPEVHYYLNSNGYYDIYVKKTESQDHIFIMDYLKSDGDEGDHVELTWTNTLVSTLPSGSVKMSNEMDKYYLSTISRGANTVLAAPNGSAGSATFRALVVADLPASGATAGSYGPSANATPGYGATFNVPYITVDAKGRVTAISTKTVKIPASDNTNTTYTFATGDNNGTFKVIPSGGTATNIAIKGLGSAAYTASSAYAAASHTHNYAGSSTAGGPATLIAMPRVTKDSKVFPGQNRVKFEEYTAGDSYNLPTNAWYHIISMQGSDTRYGTQIAIGMTANKRMYFRNYNESSWQAWNEVSIVGHTHSYLSTTTNYALSSSVGGPAYSVEGSEGTDASFRHVWFSTSNTETRRAYSDKFMFEPSLGILKFNSWYPLDITDNTVDLNSYNDGNGKYGYRRYICRSTGGGNKISNKPCDSPFLLEVFLIRFATASSDYITKQVYHAFNKKTYQRFCTNGTWDSWTELKYTDTNTKNTAGSTNTSSKIFLIGATSQAANPQTYSHDTAYVGTDGCLYSNSTKVSVEGHAHGLGHSNFTVSIDATTNTWAAIGVDGTNKYVLKSIRTNTNAPPYLLNDFSAGIVFGGEDTRGVISMKYDTPSIRFAGGNKTATEGGTAKWYITLTGTHNTTYNLDTMHQVTQTATTTSAAYEVLFSGTADNTTRTEGARKNSNLTFNPSTGILTTDRLYSARTTGTYLAGNKGSAIINSTASAGAYVMLARMHSTNGYFTHGTYQSSYLLQYTVQSTIDAGTNAVTKSVTLLNESGNSSFPGTVTAAAFNGKINGKSYNELDPLSTNTNKHCLLFYQDTMETSSGKVGADLLLDYDTIQGVLNSPGLHCGVLDALSIYMSGTGDDSGIHYKGTKASYNMIKFVDNTVDTYGNGIVIGGGGLVVMGAGESADNLVSALSLTGGQEKLYLGSDSEIYFYVNCNTIGDRKGITLNTSLSFYPNSNNTGTVGTSSNKWNAMYATTFYGAFSGSGASLTSLNASNISSGTLSADRLATSGVTAGSYGPSTNASPAHSGTFNVPYITVDNKGRVMAIATRTITLPGSGNTDTKVTQSATSTTNFRGVILGTNNTVNTGDTRETTVTGQGYITNKIFAQPSTGNLYASNIYAFVNGTDEVRIALYRSGNSSWRFLNSGGTLSLQNNFYSDKVQSWYNVAQFNHNGDNSIKLMTPPQVTGTNRSISYGYSSIDMGICSKNSWAMSIKWLNNARNAVRGSFGAYGTADNLTYYYWGTEYNATKLRLYPGTGGGLVSQQSNGFRIAANGYGVIFRVDSDNFYILLTDKKTDGSELTGDNWNSKRPLQIGLSSGVCNINGTAATAKKLRHCTLCNEASDAASYPWYRIAYAYTTGTYSDLNLVMMVTCGYGSKWGIFKARARTEGTAGTFGGTVTIEWIVNDGFTNAQLYLLTKNNYQVDTAKSGTATAEIWFKSDGRYWGYTFTVLHEGWRTGTASDLWALLSYSKNGSESYNKNASGVKGVTSSKIYSTNTPGSSSHAGYSIPFFSGPIDSSSPEKNDTATSGNKTVLHNGEFRLGLLEGTTSADGYAQLVLGNGIASGTAGNKYGKISLYSSSTYAVQIIPANLTGTRTLTLPNASGTVALTSHTHSYIPTSSAATLFSGTAAASITMTSMSGYKRLVVFCKNTSNSSYFTVELQCTTGYHYHAMTVSPPPAAQTSNSFYGLLFNLSSNTKLSVSAGKYSNLSSSASLANGPTVHITKVIGYKF